MEEYRAIDKINPAPNYILVTPVNVAETTAGGLVVAQAKSGLHVAFGRIESIGCVNEDSAIEDLELDGLVMYDPTQSIDFSYAGESLAIMKDSAVLAVIDD